MRKTLLAAAALAAMSLSVFPAYANETTDQRVDRLEKEAANSKYTSENNDDPYYADAISERAKSDAAEAASAVENAKTDLTSSRFSIKASEFSLIGGKDGPATSSNKGLRNVNSLAGQAVKLMMISLSLLCTVLLVAGGIVMATAGGNDERVTKGKTMITYSLIGLFVALSAYALIAAVGWVLG
jgi:hypothetical protein